jgi:hypothetical protein
MACERAIFAFAPSTVSASAGHCLYLSDFEANIQAHRCAQLRTQGSALLPGHL